MSGSIQSQSPSISTAKGTAQGISTETKVNIIIGVLTVLLALLSTLLAWATFRLTRYRRYQKSDCMPMEKSTPENSIYSISETCSVKTGINIAIMNCHYSQSEAGGCKVNKRNR
ncbi:hypothetical protein HYFRA_00012310 [Hymenoscyphus fraxineus]|uniref:Uncharacterized protein n=1 Tax=Hymenoscyphus fraxineus TaxID=746836 RepID=A0A9N9PV33_9HELO|nr:hypothetical protein HYFRA_00012310 [Hymenoscyphus fraxineus]